MIFFTALFFFITLIAILDVKKLISIKREKMLSIGVLFLFVITAGLRHVEQEYFTSDWIFYTGFFESVPPITDIFSADFFATQGLIEYGYFFLNSFIKTFTNDYHIFFFIYEALLCFILYAATKRYFETPLISLQIFFPILFLPLDMVYIRQAMAVVIFLYSIRFIRERKLVAYLLTVTLAVSFHFSAICIYPLYFFINKRIPTSYFIGIIGIGMLLFLLKVDIFSSVIDLIPNAKILYYLNNSEYSQARSFSIIHVEIILITFFIIRFRKKIESFNHPYTHIFINLFLIYTLLPTYFFGLMIITARVKFYFLLSYLFILPLFIKATRETYIIFAIISLYLIAYTVYVTFGGGVYEGNKNYLIELIKTKQ